MLYVRNPFLTTERRDSRALVELPPYGVRMTASAELVDVIDRFASPAPLGAARTNDEVVGQLIEYMVLLPATDADALGRGLVVPATGQLTAYHCPTSWRQSLRNGHPVLFGAPFDSTTVAGPSPKTGPAAIRRQLDALAGRRPGLFHGIDDLGDILHVAHHEPLAVAGARTRYLIGAALDDGAIPIMLGGDHSMTYYALQACAQRVDRFGVLFLDAHGDLGAASHSSLDMLNHACFVRHALAFDSMTRLLAVGVRDQASPEAPPRIERVCAERARRMDAHAIIERLPADLPIYISIDIDVLDPTLAPDVLCPSEDGMSVGAVTDLLEVACAKRQVLGADLMEVGSSCRAEDPTPEAAARLLAKLLAALLDQLAATSNAPRTPRVSV